MEPQPNPPQRGQQVKLVFQAALAFAPEQRRAFISQACSGDPLLREEVDLLLTAHEESGGDPVDSDGYFRHTKAMKLSAP